MERRHREWMYGRNHPNRRRLKAEFVEGVKRFISYAKTLSEFLYEGTIRCPSEKCNCIKLLTPEKVKMHLYTKGFWKNYYVWTVHGANYDSVGDVDFQNLTGDESSTPVENNVKHSRLHQMVWKVHPYYKIVEVNHTRKYESYDPFIIAQNVKQVFYAPYPSCKNNKKTDWWVVLKAKPVGRVEVEDALDVAYQNDISSVQQIMDNELAYELHSEDIYEEVDPSTFPSKSVQQDYGVGTSMTNEEEDSANENETNEEEEFIDENETSEEDEVADENETSDEED